MENKIRILIVEHDLFDLELLQRQLGNASIQYISEIVQNEPDYIYKLTHFMPEIILSDYNLPLFNGLSAFEIKEKIAPDLPFIFVSGTIGEERAVELIKSGVTDYALKDKLFTLPAKITRALKEAEENKQKKKTNKALLKATRLYFFISQINQSIVHETNEKVLFRNICQIAQEVGKFKIAWIGEFDTGGKKITLVEHSGIAKEDLALFSNISYKENGIQDQVLRTGTNYVCNDLANDPELESWKAYSAERDIKSFMILPIKKSSNIIGTLNLCSSEVNFFDDEEIKLLKEAVEDISFALDMFETAKQHKEAEMKLKKSNQRYSDIFHLSPQPMFVFEHTTYKFIQVNKAAIELYGYAEEEFLTITLMDILPPKNVLKAQESISKQTHKDGVFKRTVSHKKKSGEMIDVEISGTPITFNSIIARLVIAVDVTEKNLYEHKITKAIIKTQEDERYEIGSELHDNVCQLLATSQLTLGMIQGAIPQQQKEFFDQSKQYVMMALDEIRNLSHRLAPAFFDNSTLEEAFERVLGSFNMDKKYKVVLYFDKEINTDSISQDIQLNLYRILQEQLKNILKYAKATILKVKVFLDDHNITMEISDNGIGFNVDAAKQGIGLANMKRRAELFSGKCEIKSTPNNGCLVTVKIPIQIQSF